MIVQELQRVKQRVRLLCSRTDCYSCALKIKNSKCSANLEALHTCLTSRMLLGAGCEQIVILLHVSIQYGQAVCLYVLPC